MSTLTALKAEIADDFDRSDLTTAIANAISRAIRYFQATRFYFNVTRDKTFVTVADQSVYTTADDADIPEFIEFDQIHVTVSGQRDELTPIDITEWERLTDGSAATGEPYAYAYYNMQLHLYPIPDQVYTVRMLGHFKAAEPATDGEADNVWMVEAFDLIRARATGDIALNKLRDTGKAQTAMAAEELQMSRLMRETNKRTRSGELTPTQF